MKRFVLIVQIGFILNACGSNERTSQHDQIEDSAEYYNVRTIATTEGANVSDVMLAVLNDMMTQMLSVTPTGDPDHDFATMMKMHDEGAIKLAKIEAQSGGDTTMKRTAQQMITNQQREIAEFEKFLQSHKPSDTSDFAKNAKQAMSVMSSTKMDHTTTDEAFAEMMISHHQDGIVMTQEYLKTGKNNSLRKIANNIIRSKQQDVAELRSWLATQKAGGNASDSSSGHDVH